MRGTCGKQEAGRQEPMPQRKNVLWPPDAHSENALHFNQFSVSPGMFLQKERIELVPPGMAEAIPRRKELAGVKHNDITGLPHNSAGIEHTKSQIRIFTEIEPPSGIVIFPVVSSDTVEERFPHEQIAGDERKLFLLLKAAQRPASSAVERPPLQNICILLPEPVRGNLKKMGIHIDIVLHECQKFPPAPRRPGISGSARPAMCNADNGKRERAGHAPKKRRGPVGRSVIDNDDLEFAGREGLPRQAVEDRPERFASVICRYDDGEERLSHYATGLKSSPRLLQ